jgi:O-methyltransferase involved in polyketide biosynthesis
MSASDSERLAESVNKVSVGRVYDYLLGGVHNYAVDQEFAEAQLMLIPDMRKFAVTNRAFLARAVRSAIDPGIRQYVDIGSGLPTQGNVHEVADAAAPDECRVVYIDNEPIARAHAEILLEKTADPRRHRAIDADFFDRDALWRSVLDTGVIDPNQPVALLLVALLHFMPPETEPERALAFYREQLPPGSLMALSHIHVDPSDTETLMAGEKVTASYREQASSPAMPRSREDIVAFFEGMDLVEPGLVWLPQWRPDGEEPYLEAPERSRGLAGLARKPGRA